MQFIAIFSCVLYIKLKISIFFRLYNNINIIAFNALYLEKVDITLVLCDISKS